MVKLEKYKLENEIKTYLADFITICGLLFAWASIVMLISDKISLGIALFTCAFLFDIIDGLIARKYGKQRFEGKLLDSFADILIYLIFSSILSIKMFGMFYGFIAGCVILSFGILRLVRFTKEGFIENESGKYYRGLPVFYIAIISIFIYFGSIVLPFWNNFTAYVVIIVSSLLMLSNIKSYKPQKVYLLVIPILLLFLLSYILANIN